MKGERGKIERYSLYSAPVPQDNSVSDSFPCFVYPCVVYQWTKALERKIREMGLWWNGQELRVYYGNSLPNAVCYLLLVQTFMELCDMSLSTHLHPRKHTNLFNSALFQSSVVTVARSNMENIERPGLQCSPVILIKGSVLRMKGYEGLRLDFLGGLFFVQKYFVENILCSWHILCTIIYLQYSISLKRQYINIVDTVFTHCIMKCFMLYRQVRQRVCKDWALLTHKQNEHVIISLSNCRKA